jgi:AcrR family transcriptional regulator
MGPSDKREAILQATLDIIYEHGFHATPVSEIARRANVGTGSVYRYFKNKDDLLNQLYLDVKRQMFEAMHVGLAPDMPFEQLFKRIWINLFEYYTRNPRQFSFAEQYCGSPILTEATRTEGDLIFREYAGFIDKAIREGAINDVPRAVVTAALVGMTVSLVKQQLSGAIVVGDDLKHKAAHAAWCAVRR